MECRWLYPVDGTLSSGAASHAGKRRAAPPAQETVVLEAARPPLAGCACAGAAWQESCAATRPGHDATMQSPVPLRSDRAHYVNLWPLDVMEMRVFPRFFRTSKVTFGARIGLCSGFVGAIAAARSGSYSSRLSVRFSRHGAITLYRHTCLVYTALARTSYGSAWLTIGEHTSGEWIRSHTMRQVPSVLGMARSHTLLERLWWCNPCVYNVSRMRLPLGRPLRELVGDRRSVRLQTAGCLGVTKRPICCRHIQRYWI
jgi:hypothetical protein